MAWPGTIGVQRELWQPSYTVRSSGRTFAASGQRVLTGADPWVAECTVVVRPQDREDWDDLVTDSRGTFATFSLGPVTGTFAPATGSTLAAAAAAGDTSLTVNCTSSSAMPTSGYFGIASRLYRIRGRAIVTGTQATLTIYPPLRASVASSTAFDATPETAMRFVDVRHFEWNMAQPDYIAVTLEEVL